MLDFYDNLYINLYTFNKILKSRGYPNANISNPITAAQLNSLYPSLSFGGTEYIDAARLNSAFMPPGLYADFAAQVYGAIDSNGSFNYNTYSDDFTFTSGSPKNVFNAQGQLITVPAGSPAFDYDPDTGLALGQSIESSATNLLLNSFTPATQTVNVTSGTTYTLSVYGSGSAVLSGAGAGTATHGSPVTFSASTTSVTVTVSGSLDAFQLEAQAFASSPIATGGTATARDADNLTSALSGIGYNPNEGTLVVDFGPGAFLSTATASSPYYSSLGLVGPTGNTDGQLCFDSTPTGTIRFRVTPDTAAGGNSAAQAVVLSADFTAGDKVALRYMNNGTDQRQSASIGGGIKNLPANVDMSGTMANLTQLYVNPLVNATIKSIRYYPYYPTDAEFMGATA